MRNLHLSANLWTRGFLDLELVLLGAGLLVLLIIGFWMVIRIRRWQGEEEAEVLTPRRQLEQYQALKDEGLLAPEEFEKLRTRLTGRLTPGSKDDPPEDESIRR